jgi:hypothetical protein
MTAHRFVVNLPGETASDGFRTALNPRSNLVPGKASIVMRQRATSWAEGVDVYADNGHFDDIERSCYAKSCPGQHVRPRNPVELASLQVKQV